MAIQTQQIENFAGGLSVLDLRHFTSAELRPLLEEETRRWDRDLMWDYSSSAEMILRYADSRILPGYAALENGKVTAYSFFVYEGNKAVIGDVFASSASESGPRMLEDRLLQHVTETLQQTPGITRIEAQLLLHESDTIAPALVREGFARYRRLFMTLPLKAAQLETQLPAGLRLRNWQDNDFQAAAALIMRAYSGHIDSKINDQYRSSSGSMRFLNNIVRFPGCGTFAPNASFVMWSELNGEMIGLLLCSRVRDDAAHVTQVCVDPAYRGRSLGRHLIALCNRELHAKRVRWLTLTVSEANTSAVVLYERLGFSTDRRFDAFVWER